MSEKVFLKKLKGALSSLPEAERRKALDYYREQIEDRVEAGFTEEAATAELGDVRRIAAEIIAEAKDRGVKTRSTARWLVPGMIIAVLLIGLLGWGISRLYSYVKPRVDGSASGEWTEVSEVFDLPSGCGVYVDIEEYDVYFGRSDDGLAHVTYSENDRYRFTLEMTDRGLELRQEKHFWDIFSIFDEPKEARFLLPESFTGEIVSSAASGKTRVDQLDLEGKLSLSSTTGEMTVSETNAAEANFELTTGPLTVERGSFRGAVTCSGTTGRMSLKDIESGDLSVKTTTGRIKLENVSCGWLNIKATTADAELSSVKPEGADIRLTTGYIALRNTSGGKVTAITTTGKIMLEAADHSELSLQTTTGAITGTLVGDLTDYTISSSTTTGSNSLPGSYAGGERKLTAETTTGKIDVTFGGQQ